MSCGPSRTKHKESKVKVHENGRCVILENSGKVPLYVTVVDGGVVKNKLSADRVVSKVGTGDLIIELKGGDVEHACDQVAATIDLLHSCRAKRGPVAGLIVATRCPRVDTKIQRLRSRFRKEFKSSLTVSSGNRTYKFDDFFT